MNKSEKAANRAVCLKCKQKKAATEFYSNKDFSDNMGHDLWCKTCTNDFINSKEDLLRYCEENQRNFSVELYDKCEYETDLDLEKDMAYLKLRDEEQKKRYRFDLIKKQYLRRMNLRIYYQSKPAEEKIDEEDLEDQEEIICETDNMTLDDQKHYDDVWHGDFTEWELGFLNKYYANLEMQFDISDAHMEDSFREVAKSALEKTLAYNARRRKEPGSSERYKEAVEIYIKLSNQAKLSNSQRTANDRIGFSDLGTLIKMVEETGALCRKQEFEKDEVDKIIEDFYHAFRSFNPIEINKEIEDDE